MVRTSCPVMVGAMSDNGWQCWMLVGALLVIPFAQMLVMVVGLYGWHNDGWCNVVLLVYGWRKCRVIVGEMSGDGWHNV